MNTLEWGTLSAMVHTPPDKIEFRQEVGQAASFLSPPLPLIPPHSGKDAGRKYSKTKKGSHVVVVRVPKGPRLLCYSSGNDHSTLTISSLADQISCLSGETSDCQAFEDWSHTCSMLTCTELKCTVMVEPIQHIDSEIVEGVVYLCVTSTHFVSLYKIPSSADALSCKWIDHPIVHRCPWNVSHAKLSPHVAEQVLVGSEGGGLYFYQQNSKVIKIRAGIRAGKTANVPSGLTCMFGAHPLHVLWLEQGKLYSTDLRTARLPLSSVQPMCVGDGVEDIVCAVSGGSPLHPFHIFVATRTQLILVDLRQTLEPLLVVLHHLSQSPTWVASLNSPESQAGGLVLVGSADGCVLFGYQYISAFSALLTLPPHSVCMLSDTMQCIRMSELRAVAASQVEYRFRQPIVGVALLSVTSCCHGAIVMTELGDLFYQCWQYSAGPFSQLNYCNYVGLKLWIQQAHAEAQQTSDKSLPMTIRDMSCVAKYLLTGQTQSQHWTCPQCHTPLHNHAPQCEQGVVSSNELDVLKGLYQQLVPSSHLDIALVTDWERIDMNRLFEEEA